MPSLVRRAGWNLGDQMISSLTNAVLSFMVARSVSEESFGGFSIAFTVFALAVSGSRAISTSPLNIRFSDATPVEARRVASQSAGNALTLGLVVGAVSVVLGLFLPGALGESLLALGVVMPALLVQDAYRYVFFARGVPAKAALNDSVWGVLQISAVALLLVADLGAVGPLLLAWGLSAAAAAALGVYQARAAPEPLRAWSWVREHIDLTRYKLGTFAVAQGGLQGAILAIGTISSIVTVGALRGAQILLAPTVVLVVAAANFAVPELARRRDRLNSRRWALAALGISSFVALLGFVWGLIFLLAPDELGAYLLGDTWNGTSTILLAAVITQSAQAAAIGPVVVLQALDRVSSTMVIQTIFGVLTFALGVAGAALAGAPGAQWGFALANIVVLPMWAFQLRRHLRLHAAAVAARAEPDDETTLLPVVTREPWFIDEFAASGLATIMLPRIGPAPTPPPVFRARAATVATDRTARFHVTPQPGARTGGPARGPLPPNGPQASRPSPPSSTGGPHIPRTLAQQPQAHPSRGRQWAPDVSIRQPRSHPDWEMGNRLRQGQWPAPNGTGGTPRRAPRPSPVPRHEQLPPDARPMAPNAAPQAGTSGWPRPAPHPRNPPGPQPKAPDTDVERTTAIDARRSSSGTIRTTDNPSAPVPGRTNDDR